MKKDKHPEYNPVCFVDVSTGTQILTKSTAKSRKGETIEIDGVAYQLIKCDITSDSHPAYTGEKRSVDSAGRVQKFEEKFRRRRPGK